jgi:MFS family permease
LIARFCVYAILKNLRFFEPFLMLFLLFDVGLSFTAAGALLAYHKILDGLVEVPLGLVADRFGRRRTLAISFVFAAVSFGLFAFASRAAQPVLWLYVAQTIFAVGEGLRAGSHKAMILDWLSAEGRRGEATRVLGQARFWSKFSEGASALLAGVAVWLTGSFTPLFVAAVVPAVGGAALVWSYPKALEGEWKDDRAAAPEAGSGWRRLRLAFAAPGLLTLITLSVLFESQLKLAAHYLQPFLATGLEDLDLSVVGGTGALLFGVYHFVQGLVAGASSLTSAWLERRAGGPERVLDLAYWCAAGGLGLIAAATLLLADSPALRLPALVCFAGLAALQNARRPVFVAAMDERMDPAFRATILSAESQARSWIYALSALGVGLLTDLGGLPAAFLGMAALMAAGVPLAWMGRRRAAAVA